MKKKYKANWPLGIALCVFLAATSLLIISMMSLGRGSFFYSLDDAYIHMAVANHFVTSGLWGVTRYEFSSSTSSILWPLMLSGIYWIIGRIGEIGLTGGIWEKGGAAEFVPLVLNIAIGIWVLALVDRIAKSLGLSNIFRLALLIMIILATPMTTLVVTGMEHLLHIALMLMYLEIVRTIFTKPVVSAQTVWLLVMVGMFMVGVRYEGLFMTGAVALYALYKKNWQVVFASATSIVPVIAYGYISVANGWFFIPNPILMKSIHMISGTGFIDGFIPRMIFKTKMIELYHVLTLVAAVSIAAYTVRRYSVWFFIFIITVLLHVVLASFGWLYRYEAYLIVLGLLTLVSYVRRLSISTRLSEVLVGVVVVLVLVSRGVGALTETRTFVADRASEYYAQAAFIDTFYPTDTIVLNDIGMTAYFTDARIVDLAGLASREPYILYQEQGGFSPMAVEKWVASTGAHLAILKPHSFGLDKSIPPSWVEVGVWEAADKTPYNMLTYYQIGSGDGMIAEKLAVYKKVVGYGN